MKVIDESEEGLVTLETILLNFGNLSVNADVLISAAANKMKTKECAVGVGEIAEIRKSDCHLSRVPLRYIPYKVPRKLLLVLQHQRLAERLSKSQSDVTSVSDANSLLNIRLDGCDFGGRSLSSNSKEFAYEQPIKRKVRDRHCSFPAASSSFSSYRIAQLRPRPCWLQHFQMSSGCSSVAKRLPSEDDGVKNDHLDGNDCVQSQQQIRDLGLAELTDYFQHFVSLRSPRMSDQAQSMYA